MHPDTLVVPHSIHDTQYRHTRICALSPTSTPTQCHAIHLSTPHPTLHLPTTPLTHPTTTTHHTTLSLYETLSAGGKGILAVQGICSSHLGNTTLGGAWLPVTPSAIPPAYIQPTCQHAKSSSLPKPCLSSLPKLCLPSISYHQC